MTFKFDYNNQTRTDIVDELGRVIINYTIITPKGMIMFFPSYKYLSFIYDRWVKTGVLNTVQAIKKVFCEPKDAKNSEKILQEYNAHIMSAIKQEVKPIWSIFPCKTVYFIVMSPCTFQQSSNSGAIMLAVYGGKVSEGLK